MLKQGDIIRTALSNNTVVLQVNRDSVLMMAGNQFILAQDVKKNEYGTYQWVAGQYFRSLNEFMSKKVPRNGARNERDLDFKEMREQIESLRENNYREFVKALVSLECNIDSEKALTQIFENFYHNTSDMELINPNLMENLQEEIGNIFLKL